MDKETIKKSDTYKAACIAYRNGLFRCYGLEAMAHYMFLQGMQYAKNGEFPSEEYYAQEN